MADWSGGVLETVTAGPMSVSAGNGWPHLRILGLKPDFYAPSRAGPGFRPDQKSQNEEKL